MITAGPAGAAFTYNRAGAVGYANSDWNVRNPAFPTYTNDCTNFVSAAMSRGFIPQTGLWMHIGSLTATPAWAATQNFVAYNVNSRTLGGVDFAQLYFPGSMPPNPLPYPSAYGYDSAYSTGRPGDPIVYDWSYETPQWNHMSILVATEYVGTYWDGNVPYVYNRYMDVVNQHGTDRYHVPWSFARQHDLRSSDPFVQYAAPYMNIRLVAING